jgi:hypothetical protein
MLPARADSVPHARRFVRGALVALGAGAACDDAETLVSELATNAVIHGRTRFTVDVTRRGRTVRVDVRDLSRVLPRQRTVSAESTTGRGLRLVATLSVAWGAVLEGEGKDVWFELLADGSAPPPARDDAHDVAHLLAACGGLDRENCAPADPQPAGRRARRAPAPGSARSTPVHGLRSEP